jgi:hypothetical protein
MAAWRKDLQVIAAELPKRHPNLFYRMSRATWDSAVASIDQRLPTMTRNQALVSLMQLVALVGDGHTTINALFDGNMGVHYYPIEMSLFDDGLYAMRVILSRGSSASLSERILQLVQKGDTTAALKAITDDIADPVNRFRTPEADVHALGYRLLESDRPAAIAVFRLNTRAFPRSANTWDSLGEALLANGQRDEGIASYRKALELDPQMPSANEALRRLGVSGRG